MKKTIQALLLALAIVSSLNFMIPQANAFEGIKPKFQHTFHLESLDSDESESTVQCGSEEEGYESFTLTQAFDWLVDDSINTHADFLTIQDAITNVNEDDVIAVCPGKYKEDLRFGTKGLTLLGANNFSRQRIIGHAIIDHADSVTFVNFTFEGGMGDAINGGGAIASYSDELIIRSSHFLENEAAVGGALSYFGQHLNISASIFENNSAPEGFGGAIVIMHNNTISDSEWRSEPGLSGRAEVDISETIFRSNSAGISGGAIVCMSCDDMVFNKLMFIDNEADSNGGAIWVLGDYMYGYTDLHATLEINDSIFARNILNSGYYSTGEGAAINVSDVNLYIENTQFSHNSTGYVNNPSRPQTKGGAIYMHFVHETGDFELKSSSLDHNESELGAAIFLGTSNSGTSKTNALIQNTTFYANEILSGHTPGESSIWAGGQNDIQLQFSSFIDNIGPNAPVAFGNSLGTTFNIQNVLLDNNLDATGAEASCALGREPISNGNNSDSAATCLDGSVSGDLLNSSPVYSAPFGIYTLATAYMPLDPSSPQVDAGACISGVSLDQAKKARLYGSSCDIGAIEYRP